MEQQAHGAVSHRAFSARTFAKQSAAPSYANADNLENYEQQGDRPLSLTEGTNKSANIIWESSSLHRGAGLAGLGKINRQTLAKPGD